MTDSSSVAPVFPPPQREFPPLTASSARLSRWKHNAISLAVAPLTYCGRCAPTGSFGILMYHRVVPEHDPSFPPTYNVTPERFEAQLAGLLKRGYIPWSLDQLVHVHELGEPIPEQIFAVTFDDGFENNYLYAFPILQRLNVPATIFIATAYLDSAEPFPFDTWVRGRESTLPSETWRPAVANQYHEMLESGIITLGAHTHWHADYRQSPNLLHADLQLCCQILKSQFGVSNPHYSHPFGVSSLGFANPQFVETAKHVGCQSALRIDNELADINSSPFQWPRFDVAQLDTATSLIAKLDGWYQRARQPLQSVSGRARRKRVSSS